jgi:hypothetical protein
MYEHSSSDLKHVFNWLYQQHISLRIVSDWHTSTLHSLHIIDELFKRIFGWRKKQAKIPEFSRKKKNKRKTKTKMKFVGEFRENIFNIFWFLDVKGHDFKSNSRSYTYHFMIHIIVGRAAVITMRWCYIIRDKKEENK